MSLKKLALSAILVCTLCFQGSDSFAITIGADLTTLPAVGLVDSYAGIIIAITDDPFSEVGVVTDWSFYAMNPGSTDRYVTPLILSREGTVFDISGIGNTVIVGAGTKAVLTQDFGLLYGSDFVDPGDIFGWWYGNITNIAISRGSVFFTNNSAGGGVIYSQTFNTISTETTFTPQTGYTVNGELSRNYFFSATASERSTPVPEPNTLLLLGFGLIATGLVRRLKRTS